MAKMSSSENTKKKGKNNKKKKIGLPKALIMKNKLPKDNPFESIWSRSKFEIMGKKKRKDEERRRVGRSRSLAIQKRKNTLLNEYEQNEKSSVFIDKRIGEQNEVLGEFDKALLRSQRERQLKVKKKSKFNLSDGEEDDFPEREDFEDEGPLDEDEYGQIGSNKWTFGRHDHNGAEDSPEPRSLDKEENRHKSKKEVMEDIISKSKFFKAEKAKEKEENEEFIEQLDKDFASLGQSEAMVSLTQPNKMKALKSLVNNSISNDNAKKDMTNPMQNKVFLPQEKPDYYDKLVGQMALDMRARPSDRTKAPEELAQEEKERLELLEEERQKRMIAADDSSNEDEDTSEDDEKSVKRQKYISGDDLGDSFSHDSKLRNKVVSIDEILSSEDPGDGDDDDDDGDDDEDDEEGSEEDDGEDEKSQSLKDWEQSDDDIIDNDDEEYGEERKQDRRGKQISDKIKTDIVEKSSKDRELPFTIEAPKTFEELSSLLENRSDDEVIEAIRRIRSFNAITIAAENRKKIQVFYGVLLQYFAVLATKTPLNLKLLNMLVKPLMELSTEIPYFAAICARQRLLRIRTQFCEDIKNTGKSCWPSVKTLFLLRLWSMIFPCSDFRHAVMTPAMLLMSEYLMRCPIISGRDVAVGSFLCSMVLSVCRQSQKFCPEAITFIQTMLMAALNHKQGCEDSQLYHLMEIKTLRPLLHVQGPVEKIDPLDFLLILNLPDDSPYFASDNFRTSILFAIVGTLKGFINIYESFKSFPEIFLPISRLLLEIEQDDHITGALKVEMKDIVKNIKNKSEEQYLLRQPLRMRKQKIIYTAVPKFEENFVKGRDYDPDRERAERKKMMKLLKQEAKGAVRELRKDNYFLLEVKERDKERSQLEKAKKLNRNLAFLEQQEHAFKSGQLGKGKGKKRKR